MALVLAKKTPKEQKKTALIKQPAWLRHEPSRNTSRSARSYSLHRAAKELKAAGRKAKLASLCGNWGRLLSMGWFYRTACGSVEKNKMLWMSSQD